MKQKHCGWIGSDLWLGQAGRKLENGDSDCQKEEPWHAKSKLGASKGNSPPPFEQDFAAFSSDHGTCMIGQFSSSTQVLQSHTSYSSPTLPIFLWRKDFLCGDISDWKTLFARIIRSNLGLNAHSLCANLGLNAHSPDYYVALVNMGKVCT